MKTSPLLLVVASLRSAISHAKRPRLASKPKLRKPKWVVQNQNCADSLSQDDCQLAKDNCACYVYAEECAETCGCDFDLAEARQRNGLDDAFYDSPNFKCVDGDDFEDYQHFNCTLYEGAKWCEVDAAGEVVEGPGWCSWFNPVECGIDQSIRWPHHEWYANAAGQWAKSCCCDTGVADTYPYEGGGECADQLNSEGGTWHDPNGYSCRAYHFGSFCTLEGGDGTGWDLEAYGPISEFVYDGMSPLEACCTCGGSDFATPSTSTSIPTTATNTPSYRPTTYMPTSNPAPGKCDQQQQMATSRL